MTDSHISHKTNGKTKRLRKEGDHFNRDDKRRQSGRNTARHKCTQIAPFLFMNTDTNIKQKRKQGQPTNSSHMRSEGKRIREQTEQVSESYKKEQSKNKRKVAQSFSAGIFFK